MSEPGPSDESLRVAAMVARFLALAGIDDAELTPEAQHRLDGPLAEIGAQGLRESDLAVLGQAYLRAVGRVVAAEVEALSRLHGLAPGGDPEELSRAATRMLPLGREVFDVLHGVLLTRAVGPHGQGWDRSRRSRVPTAVAHVDVIDSTAFLETAAQAGTQRLVDGLFAAAQAAVRGRAVEVAKYVGDGVFLLGPDPEAVAAASLACIDGLDRLAGLRSRAGLAFGRVVYRAGDVFGRPVNLSHRLTKASREGVLLVAALAPARLPAVLCGNPRELELRGIDGPVAAYELVGGDLAVVPARGQRGRERRASST
ncbi:adenylate/guanylate cyclase domain-containing protein [Conexibacter sp. DBS9H8]|uniref:adenylate/guanylate cyclase domain-containing protein n=1 Tax=Conexibacter sp. DBS9H8 TaxID=2937801 RepID=UPI00200E4077|nr:adenylate/guanylate cyclase domain-containing protein [Conexibacter sp. DBS9H8]